MSSGNVWLQSNPGLELLYFSLVEVGIKWKAELVGPGWIFIYCVFIHFIYNPLSSQLQFTEKFIHQTGPNWSKLIIHPDHHRGGEEGGRAGGGDCCGVLRYIIHDMLISSQTLCGRKTRPSRIFYSCSWLQHSPTYITFYFTFGFDGNFLFYFGICALSFPSTVLLSSIEFIYVKLSLCSLLTILAGVKPQT